MEESEHEGSAQLENIGLKHRWFQPNEAQRCTEGEGEKEVQRNYLCVYLADASQAVQLSMSANEDAINSIEVQKIVTLCDKILLKTLQLKGSSLLSLTCATLLTTWEAGSSIVYSPLHRRVLQLVNLRYFCVSFHSMYSQGDLQLQSDLILELETELQITRY